MALDFVKNTANYLTYGAGAFNAVLNGASKIAVSAVVWLDAVSTGSAFDNRILSVVIDGTLAGVVLSINATGANDVVRFRGRSSSGEAEEISDGATHIATGAWIQVGGLLNIGGDSINTVRAGVVDSTTAVTFANATFTPGTPSDVDRIGAATEVPVAFIGRASTSGPRMHSLRIPLITHPRSARRRIIRARLHRATWLDGSLPQAVRATAMPPWMRGSQACISERTPLPPTTGSTSPARGITGSGWRWVMPHLPKTARLSFLTA